MDKKKILVVDDDPDIIEVVKFSFELEGYEVIIAANGWEALGAFRAKAPDLIVLDVMLPKENGYKVAQMIREDEQSGRVSKKTPIILLTARNLSSDPEREKIFLNFSNPDFMMYKPFDMGQLIKKVRELLKHAK